MLGDLTQKFSHMKMYLLLPLSIMEITMEKYKKILLVERRLRVLSRNVLKLGQPMANATLIIIKKNVIMTEEIVA